jgi:Family of unknown function (DUF6159)
MDRIYRSWELFKSSLVVMMQNKTLLAFPILITIITSFMVVLFVTPVAFRPTGHSYASHEHWDAVIKPFVNYQNTTDNTQNAPGAVQSHNVSLQVGTGVVSPLALGYFAAMYFASMFLATFLNVAFYHEIMNALGGQPVSIADGLRFAVTRWKIILMWTLFAGIVGFIIKTLERRFGIIGQITLKIIGAVWSVACVFVIPVIVTQEDTANPFAVLKKSAQTLIQTWGESLTGYAGIGFISTMMALLSFVWLIAGIALAVAMHSILLGVGAVLSWLAIICLVSYLIGVASQIFRCALYLYATQGTMPQPYTQEMASLAWRMKKS